MARGNQRLVLRYYKLIKSLNPKKFAYHLLLLFYPFAKEEGIFRTHSGKLIDPMICATVNGNKHIFEPNSEILTQDQDKHFYHDEQQNSAEVNQH